MGAAWARHAMCEYAFSDCLAAGSPIGQEVVVGKLEKNTKLRRPTSRCGDNIKIYLK
jgi:hypothetical protein